MIVHILEWSSVFHTICVDDWGVKRPCKFFAMNLVILGFRSFYFYLFATCATLCLQDTLFCDNSINTVTLRIFFISLDSNLWMGVGGLLKTIC